jgi:polysaccharide pyruvyl transferase WcaK-like protein
MSIKMKICLLGATFTTNNMGVNALTVGAIKSIHYKYPEAEIILLDYNTEKLSYNVDVEGKKVSVQLVNMLFSRKIFQSNHILLLLFFALLVKIIPFKAVRKKIIGGNEILNVINKIDFANAISGGDSFSDIYGIRRFYYVSLPQILIVLMEKKLILLPQTLGPFKRKTVKFWASYIMRHAYLVFSRDNSSIQEMKRMLGSKFDQDKFKFCYDVGFVLDPIPSKEINSDSNIISEKSKDFLVGLNVSGLLYMGGYTRNNMFGLKVDYHQLISEILDFLINKNCASVLLIPHVFGVNNPESDAQACMKTFDQYKDQYKEKINVVRNSYNQNEIKYIIGLCDFFIGSRMHACIAAISQCIPAVSVAYSKKFYGVMESIGVEDLVADPRNLEMDELMMIIRDSMNNRDSLRKKLKTDMPRVKETVLNLYSTMDWQ